MSRNLSGNVSENVLYKLKIKYVRIYVIKRYYSLKKS